MLDTFILFLKIGVLSLGGCLFGALGLFFALIGKRATVNFGGQRLFSPTSLSFVPFVFCLSLLCLVFFGCSVLFIKGGMEIIKNPSIQDPFSFIDRFHKK